MASSLLLSAILAPLLTAQAQSYAPLYTFPFVTARPIPYALTNGSGANPIGGLLLSSGVFYGACYAGGAGGLGTIFAINTNGTNFHLLHSFTNAPTDGASPYGGLTISGGTLYGTASGANDGADYGVIFSLSTNGTGYSNLYRFTDGTDGAMPNGNLVLAGSLLYGTTQASTDGKPNPSPTGGTVFSIATNSQTINTLYTFQGDPANPVANSTGTGPAAGLALAGSTLYGTTFEGGTNNYGVIFALNINGSGFKVLHHFDTNGAMPQCQLIVAGSTLYGLGGTCLFSMNTNGSGFTVLYDFGATVFYSPIYNPGLVLSGATLFATGLTAGSNQEGIIFSIATNGAGYADSHDYSALNSVQINGYPYNVNSDGASPNGSLTLANGRLYGTAAEGGSTGSGLLFSVVPQPPPLSASRSGTNLLLSTTAFNGFSYTIQQTTNPSVSASWTTFTNFLGTGVATQFTKSLSAPEMNFRLRQN
ncbi:MAG: hypothetical protein C5B50_07030 [Verrucomicrobia bacterium]|nr:MAG: hypothetical protein C5B50_07030 [Verrucomicrobiota bacterium]